MRDGFDILINKVANIQISLFDQILFAIFI